jgi:hypothetical protein
MPHYYEDGPSGGRAGRGPSRPPLSMRYRTHALCRGLLRGGEVDMASNKPKQPPNPGGPPGQGPGKQGPLPPPPPTPPRP